MKTLLLLRHGQAEKNAAGGDKDRGLTEKGARDAATQARRLLGITGVPDVVVASEARRAYQTAVLVAAVLGYTARIETERHLYYAEVETTLHIIHHLAEDVNTALLVGHNPGFEQVGTMLATEGTPAVDLPTAGVIHLTFDVAHWSDVQPATGHLVAIYRPKDAQEH